MKRFVQIYKLQALSHGRGKVSIALVTKNLFICCTNLNKSSEK